MKRYRVGIIGFGAIGKVHAWAYSALPFHYAPMPFEARVTTVVTAHESTAQAAAQVCGAETFGTDFRLITENPDVDVVHICSPNGDHCRQMESAIAHDKLIYCDKPLVATWDEARALVAAVNGNHERIGMAFQIRWFPSIMRAAQLMSDNRIGRVLSFRISYLHSGSADPETPAKWKLTQAAGGGVIADLASHVLDLLSFLGGVPTRINARSEIAYSTRPSVENPGLRIDIDAEDHVVALVHARFGHTPVALGTIEATKIATGTEDELRLEIHGTDGAIRFDSMTPHWLWFYDNTRSSTPIGGERGWTGIDTGQRYPPPASAFPGPKFALGWTRTHLASIAAFLYAAHEQRKPSPGFEEALYNQHLVDCMQRSARTGAEVAPESRSRIIAMIDETSGRAAEVETGP